MDLGSLCPTLSSMGQGSSNQLLNVDIPWKGLALNKMSSSSLVRQSHQQNNS